MPLFNVSGATVMQIRDSADIKILIDGVHTHLTRNIIFSLFRILPRGRDFTLLWVDALCINKSGCEEVPSDWLYDAGYIQKCSDGRRLGQS